MTSAIPWSFMKIASNGHTSTQVPNPRHPKEQLLLPPFTMLAALQSCIPIYSYFSLALSHVPLQMTCAIIFVLSSTTSPMISATFSAVSDPPTGHPLALASPFATALANPSHPGYPHPPQLAPGRTSLTATAFGSISTANFCEA